jgi:hypothetical protein
MPVFSSNTYTFIYYLAYQKQINIINKTLPINRIERSLFLDRYKLPDSSLIKKSENKNPYSSKLIVLNGSIYSNNGEFYLNNSDSDSDSDSDDEYGFDLILYGDDDTD